MWNVFFRLSDIQRKLSLQIFHAFCEFVIIIMLALGGCLAETLLSKFNSHHCLGFSVFHHDLCLGGWGGGGDAFVKQHIYHFIFGFRGNLNRV